MECKRRYTLLIMITTLEDRVAFLMVDSAGNPLIDPIIELPNEANPNRRYSFRCCRWQCVSWPEHSVLIWQIHFWHFIGEGSHPDGKLFLGKPKVSGLWDYEQLALKVFLMI